MPATQIAFLAAMGGSLLASLAAMILALRTRGLPRKPLWALIALVGVGGGALVLARPDHVYWFFGIAVPTASVSGLDARWQPQTLQFLFPVGALLVFVRLHCHRARGREVGAGH